MDSCFVITINHTYTQDWFLNISRQLFNPKFGLFVSNYDDSIATTAGSSSSANDDEGNNTIIIIIIVIPFYYIIIIHF